jgi:hypothetical protein
MSATELQVSPTWRPLYITVIRKMIRAMMTDLLPYALPAAAVLLALLLAPAVDRCVERFDAWVGEQLKGGNEV